MLDSSFCLPIGKAKVYCQRTFGFFLASYILKYFLPVKLWQIEREGKDVTIVAYSKMVGFSLQVCYISVNGSIFLCSALISSLLKPSIVLDFTGIMQLDAFFSPFEMFLFFSPLLY